jgi:uncharacterized protein
MPSDITIHEYKHMKFDKAMVIVGFPSIGLVSSIAANFIVRTLKLEKIATILSDDFPPYSLVHEGEVSPPVRIHAGNRMCDEKGEKCDQLIVITSEFMPAPNLLRPLTAVILDWCRHNDVNTIMALEGMNAGDNPEQREVLAVATGDNCKKMLANYSIKELREGMVSGLSGVLLYEAERTGMDAICLLGPGRADYPDARGAARLMEVVAKMLPEIKLDPDPLFKEAEQIEKDMKAAFQAIKGPGKRQDESVLYG